MSPNRWVMLVIVKFVLVFTLLIGFCLPVQAGDGDCKKKNKDPRPVGMVNSSNGGIYKPGQLGFVMKHIYYNQDQLFQGSDEIDFVPPQPGETPSKKCYERSVNQTQMTLRAGVFKDFDVRLIIPLFNKDMDFQTATSGLSEDNLGLGDLKFIARYQLLSQKTGPFNLALGLGLKMPTGETGEEDDSGKLLPGFLQTGSGSWDPIFELGAHKVIGRHWISGYFSYLLTTEGELGELSLERPDVFKYNLGYAFAVHKIVDLQLELNGFVKGKSVLDGETVESSGGHSIYVTPGIHIKFTKGIHFGICAPIAVYHDLNGTQLAEDFRIVAKMAIKFDAF